jgi:hypothetical protein
LRQGNHNHALAALNMVAVADLLLLANNAESAASGLTPAAPVRRNDMQARPVRLMIFAIRSSRRV